MHPMQEPESGPVGEPQRQAALDRLQILDTVPEQAYDDLTRVAAAVCNAPMALVSLIDRDRQWFKSRYGIDFAQTERCIAFCDYAIRVPQQMLVVSDTRRDPRFRDNPLVHLGRGIRFYAGVPLVSPDGFAVGTLCVLDSRPRRLSKLQRDALEGLARQVSRLLELRLRNLELREALAERDRLAHQLAKLASTDALTLLRNRRAFDVLRADQREAPTLPMTVVMLDIDHVKAINDTHGHAVGDQILRRLADTVRSVLRRDDEAVRYGGEEFALVLPGTDGEGARILLERLRAQVASLRVPVPFTFSAGYAEVRPGESGIDPALARADAALYAAKANGRDRIEAADAG